MKQKSLVSKFFLSINWKNRVLTGLLGYVFYIHIMWVFTGHFESRLAFFIGWGCVTLMLDYISFRKHLNKREERVT